MPMVAAWAAAGMSAQAATVAAKSLGRERGERMPALWPWARTGTSGDRPLLVRVRLTARPRGGQRVAPPLQRAGRRVDQRQPHVGCRDAAFGVQHGLDDRRA